jgi:hypothetical protein
MTPPQDEAAEIAADAYVYAYPLVLMDVTRRVLTNSVAPDARTGRGAPVNQFAHLRLLLDATFTDVVRANADTLYSSLWFDVRREPLVVRVPDSRGRYYLLQLLDAWADVFASLGKRTTGTGPQTFAIAGPGWAGEPLPAGVELIRSPTAVGWMVGRTQTDGTADYAAVHAFQDGMTATPLSAWGTDYRPPRGNVHPDFRWPPAAQVAEMDAAAFFGRFAELTRHNPPHANDHPILARMRRLGLVPGVPFDLASIDITARAALEAAVPVALERITGWFARGREPVNGWRMLGPPVGTYGTAYLDRAGVSYVALGANVPEDSIYPTAIVDADGEAFDSAGRYELRFAGHEVPPARAFWSLTLYDDRQLFADNPIGRYSVGDRDDLRYSEDGSLTLYVQRDTPGAGKESNWLPAPKSGGFSLSLRLFWPRAEALDGRWQPPAVRRVG